MSATRARAQRSDQTERGNSLLLALLFITSIAFLSGVSMDYAYSTIRGGASNRDAQSARYAAAGAIDLMVQAMRADPTLGRAGATCSGVSLTLADGRVASAQCAPVAGSGALLAEGTGARANRVVDVVANVSGVPLVKARITINDAAGSMPAATVATREWIGAP